MDVNVVEERKPAAKSLSPVPKVFLKQVAIDLATMTVYTSRQIALDPLFMSWKERNQVAGVRFKVEVMDMAEISRLQDAGHRVVERRAEEGHTAEVGYENRAEALELLETAARYRASDVHFLLRGKHAEVLLTVNNDLRFYREFTQDKAALLVRAIWQGSQ